MEFNVLSKYNYSALPYFIIFCFYIRVLYFFMYTYFYHLHPRFKLLDNNKKLYVVKNVVKSYNLCALSFFSLPFIIYPAVVYQTWDSSLMHICGLFYSSNDFVALFYVKKLSPTTINHHKITTLLSLFALFIDYTSSSLGRMLFIYTLASSYAFIVNYYLGSRFLYDKKDTSIIKMKKCARNIYALTLFCNWNWHIYWSVSNFNLLEIQHFIYFCLMVPVIKDDLILLTWLCN